MTIAVGASVGPYEVVDLIGEGGMGRVFRARDTRLKRDVALKAVSAGGVASDPDRVPRMRREAEALAALNHPHIAGIHDLVEADGALVLVLELVEGDTLADRIARGPLPVTETVGLAQQIAGALEAAHARGIVHRDLKPANVKVTPAGQIKVLDFGLARMLDARETPGQILASNAGAANSPTFTSPAMTAHGVILGTAAYMSPEQARGQTAGPQADIWALGCVLYEMLTGRPPFSGATITDVLAAVVRGEPDWPALPQGLPSTVNALLRRCLEKDLTRRLQHVGDVRIALEDAFVTAPPTDARATAAPASKLAWIAAAVLALVAMALALAIVRRPETPDAQELWVSIATPPAPDPMSIALSSDGSMLAYSAVDGDVPRLWVRRLRDGTARALPGTELASLPFWSPDNRSLGFFADGRLKRVDLAGGQARVLANATVGGGGTWNRDDVIVFAPSAIGSLFRMPAGGGEPVAITKLEPSQSGHRFPHFLPDGRHVLYYTRANAEHRGVFVTSIDGAAPRRVVDADAAGRLLGGTLVFQRQTTLLAQRFDQATQTVGGEAVTVASGVSFDGSSNMGAFAVGGADRLVFRQGGFSGQRQLTWVDRAGTTLGTIGPADNASMANPDLSADGQRVLVNRSTVDGFQDVWLVDVPRALFTRFTLEAGVEQLPIWSRDGQRVVYGSNRAGAYDLYEKAVSGAGLERPLFASAENKFPMSFSPDGRHLLYRLTTPRTDWDLWVLPIAADGTPGTPFAVAQTAFQEMMGEFSPDGRWLAYQSNESGQYEIYVRSFPDAATRVQVSTNGGAQPRWRGDGRELFYMALDGRLTAVPLSSDADRRLQAGAPVPLFMTRTPGGPIPIPQKQQYAVAADGQRFLINSLPATADAPITLLLNWKPPAQ